MNTIKLSPISLGLSLGVLWGVSLFLMGLAALYFSYGHAFVASLGSVYLGYTPTLTGSILGGVIGFIDAFITGVLIAWLYNLFSGCVCFRSHCQTTETKTKDINDIN